MSQTYQLLDEVIVYTYSHKNEKIYIDAILNNYGRNIIDDISDDLLKKYEEFILREIKVDRGFQKRSRF